MVDLAQYFNEKSASDRGINLLLFNLREFQMDFEESRDAAY